MGKASGITPARWKGKVGQAYFRQVGDETIVSQLPDKKEVPDRYYLQMVQRVKMASMVNPYRLISPYFDYSFEKEKPTQNMYNLFTKNNESVNYTYLTKDEVEHGAAILRPFCISQGSLDPAIGVEERDGNYVFDLCVGDLELGPSTKLMDFSTAVILHSPFKKLHNGDGLRVYICTQVFEVGNALPTIRCQSYKVDLETNSLRAGQKLLSESIPAGVLTTVALADGNHLAIPAASNKMVAIVHSHRVIGKESERVVVTTQNLFGNNPLQETYLTADRLEVAIDSFGGVNRENLVSPTPRHKLTLAELIAAADITGSGSTGGSGLPGGGPGTVEAYTITPRVEPDASFGTITMVPSQMPVPAGSQVRLTATPAGGKRLDGWSTGSTEATITVTVTGNETVTATFSTIATGGGTPGLGSKEM